MSSPSEPLSPSGADHISLLHDDLLHSILSFLPDTDARARTSVLSRRFRHLWAHHPSVRLGHVPHLRSDHPHFFPSVARYRRSVDRCLSSLRSPLLSLDLRLFSSRSAHRWIRTASFLSVSRLILSADPSNSIHLPRTIFSCRSLVSLDLSSLSFSHTLHPHFPGFPSLSTLKFTGCDIDDHALASLLHKCPSLRTLSLDMCHELTSLHISSSTLSDLNLFFCCSLQTLTVDAPNLTSVTFIGNAKGLCLKNAHRLLDANVCHILADGDADFSTHFDWTRLVVSLAHVSKRLRVSGWFFRFLLPECVAAPLFKNLEVLHCCVDWVTPHVLDGLVSMLGHCLNLEQLNIDLSCGARKSVVFFKQWMKIEEGLEKPDYMNELEQRFEDDKEKEVWDPSKLMKEDAGVAHKLKTIIVNMFLGTPNEMKMLEYLLSRASILEKLKIGDCMMRDKEEILQLLAYIPRASPHVQICELELPRAFK